MNMQFCPYCGTKLDEGARFCKNCGEAIVVETQHQADGVAFHATPKTEAQLPKVEQVKEDSRTKRKIVYDGEIHKCPNCGEIIDAFVTNCPACDYEIRGSKATVSLQQFYWDLHRAKNAEEKASMIRNYPVPNSKEDIVEFMILASSNISGEADKTIFEAWVAKFEQVYQKAQIALQNDPSFAQIEDIYEKTEKAINKEKITHTTASVGNMITTYFKFMPNPVFAVVLVLLLLFNFIRLFSGQFAGMDIIFDAIILAATYGITNKKNTK